uniref:Large ribosomal subunit protein uL10m n=1 Tax=Anas platyrhynchos platyrhynchos TaxID=8840 RepID=A0A493TEU6_ANAPP
MAALSGGAPWRTGWLPALRLARCSSKAVTRHWKAMHLQRQKLMAVTEYLPPRPPGPERCLRPPQQPRQEDNGYARLLRRQVEEVFRDSRMVAVCQYNAMPGEDVVLLRHYLRKHNIEVKFVLNEIVRPVLSQSRYRNLLPLFVGRNILLVSPETKAKEMLRVLKGVPQVNLLGESPPLPPPPSSSTELGAPARCWGWGQGVPPLRGSSGTALGGAGRGRMQGAAAVGRRSGERCLQRGSCPPSPGIPTRVLGGFSARPCGTRSLSSQPPARPQPCLPLSSRRLHRRHDPEQAGGGELRQAAPAGGLAGADAGCSGAAALADVLPAAARGRAPHGAAGPAHPAAAGRGRPGGDPNGARFPPEPRDTMSSAPVWPRALAEGRLLAHEPGVGVLLRAGSWRGAGGSVGLQPPPRPFPPLPLPPPAAPELPRLRVGGGQGGRWGRREETEPGLCPPGGPPGLEVCGGELGAAGAVSGGLLPLN